MPDHIHLAVQAGQGVIQIVQPVAETVDLGLGLGGLHNHRLACLAALEHDCAQFLNRLFQTIQPFRRPLIQRFVQRRLGYRFAGEGERAERRRRQHRPVSRTDRRHGFNARLR